MVRPKPPWVVPRITAGLDTEVGVTHDTTTSRAGSAPKVRWTCSAVTVSALAACCHRTGPLATIRPPAVTPTPPRNARRETPSAPCSPSLLSLLRQSQTNIAMLPARDDVELNRGVQPLND